MVRYSGPERTYPLELRWSAEGLPITVPVPSTVPSAVFIATSALPSPSWSYTWNCVECAPERMLRPRSMRHSRVPSSVMPSMNVSPV